MNEKKMLPLLLIPLTIFMLVPVASVKATTPNYYVYFTCRNFTSAAPPTNRAFASFLAHSYSFVCPTGAGSWQATYSFASSSQGTFFGYISIAGHKAYLAAPFSQASCVMALVKYNQTPYLWVVIQINAAACN